MVQHFFCEQIISSSNAMHASAAVSDLCGDDQPWTRTMTSHMEYPHHTVMLPTDFIPLPLSANGGLG